MKTINTLYLCSAISLATLISAGCSSEDVNSTLGSFVQGDAGGQAASQSSENINSGRSAEGLCSPTDDELHVLDVINQARSQARYCGNDFYAAAPPVTWNCQLEAAAYMHSEDMVANNFFAHEGSDGLKAGHRIEAVGYNWRVYGENLAAGHATIEAAMVDLLASPGHCRNVMNAKVTEFGSAVIFPDVSLGLDYQSYWSHEFATPIN